MIMFDKKKAMATIMSRRQHKDGSMTTAPMVPSAAQTENGMADERHSAAQDIMAAMEEKHPGKLMDAMMKFMDAHNSHKAEDTTPKVTEGPDTEE